MIKKLKVGATAILLKTSNFHICRQKNIKSKLFYNLPFGKPKKGSNPAKGRLTPWFASLYLQHHPYWWVVAASRSTTRVSSFFFAKPVAKVNKENYLEDTLKNILLFWSFLVWQLEFILLIRSEARDLLFWSWMGWIWTPCTPYNRSQYTRRSPPLLFQICNFGRKLWHANGIRKINIGPTSWEANNFLRSSFSFLLGKKMYKLFWLSLFRGCSPKDCKSCSCIFHNCTSFLIYLLKSQKKRFKSSKMQTDNLIEVK